MYGRKSIGSGHAAQEPLYSSGIKDLRGERFPSAGRAAVHEPRPAGADAAELLLEVGDQLVGDRVAVRAEVLRVHRVRIVVVRVGVLDLDEESCADSRGPVQSL